MAVQIVLLNGASSSGKSTIAEELQSIMPDPWLLLGIDTFTPMLPFRLLGAVNPSPSDSRSKGTWYDVQLPGDQVAQIEAIRASVLAGEMTVPEALDNLGVADQLAVSGVRIRYGAYARRLITGMHRALAALASAGNNLIVDHVFLERDWVTECATALAPYSVLFVGIRCSVAVLLERERGRADRMVGLAMSDAHRVHWDGVYDLEIHTDECSPSAAAAKIAARVHSGSPPTALRTYSSSQRPDANRER